MTTKVYYYTAFFGVSLGLFLCTWWIMDISAYLSSAIQSMCYFILAIVCTHKAKEQPVTLFGIGCALMMGRFLIEIPIRCYNFFGTASTLIFSFNVIVSIILGIITYREHRTTTLCLSVIIIVLLNTIATRLWDITYGFN